MAARRPWTDVDTAELTRLHGEGLSAHAIAREMGRSKSTVAKYAKAAGLSFAARRSRTAEATRALVLDSKAKRARLEGLLLDDALALREQLWQPTKVYSFGGRDNTYNERTLEQPPFDGQQKIMQAVGIAVDRAVKLSQYDADPGTSAAKSLLAGLAEHLGLDQ